ncbi:hypothetical protein [Streptomyces sp. NWU339]|uniref:hypothetical protein n=1 Tax=Streptomyces sp. NWU339 TaxID=2185284 RepID=UPI0015E7F7FB|nr:hypothetical protein [Streptomyces sp. NWU339]
MRDEVGRAFAAPGSFDGVDTGEGQGRHQLLPADKVVDGPHVVLGRIEADPAELVRAEPAPGMAESPTLETPVTNEVRTADRPKATGCRHRPSDQ